MNLTSYVHAERLSRSVIISKYNSSCIVCTETILKGSIIVYDNELKIAMHEGDCFMHYIAERLVTRHDQDPGSISAWDMPAVIEAEKFLDTHKLSRRGSETLPTNGEKIRRNKYAQNCWVCNHKVPEMTGRLFFVAGENSSEYNGKKGWLVEHLSCGSEAIQKRPDSPSKMVEFIAKVRSETGLDEKLDFTWCDKHYRLGDEIMRDDKFAAVEYLMVDKPPGKPEEVVVCGFTVKPLN